MTLSLNDKGDKDSFPSLTLLYRCRYIILFYALWSTVVVTLGGHKQEWVLDWDWSVYLIVAWATIQFITLFFRRIHHSYMRVEQSIPLWRDVSQSIASFARSVQSSSEGANAAVQTRALHLLEELVVALQLVNEPQHPTVSDKAISVNQPVDEDLRGCFPTIPSDGATVGGITSDVWYTPWKLINIDLLNVVVAMKGNRNDRESVFTAEARVDLLDDINEKLEALKWLRPYLYIVHLWVAAVVYCIFLPLVLSLVGVGWKCVPITIVAASLFFPCMVAADDNDHMMNHCNAPCGFISALSADPFKYAWGCFVTKLSQLRDFKFTTHS
ncbi:hypothetical protein ONZ45_g11062 [Pleurotus djamor]|nr:hypothetical protein ONZ45_g11062 [Pleurotus djamor]